MALGPTHPPIQWVPETLYLGVKWPGHEADHSPSSNTEVKEWVDLYFHSPKTPSWHGAQLEKKHSDNFTFPINNFIYLILQEVKLQGRRKLHKKELHKYTSHLVLLVSNQNMKAQLCGKDF
jgi:hypothetical protein